MSFLFGNLDPEGELDVDSGFLDEEEKKQLTKVAEAFGDDFFKKFGEEKQDQEDSHGFIRLEEAQDFMDIEELAEDVETLSSDPIPLLKKSCSSSDENYDDEEDSSTKEPFDSISAPSNAVIPELNPPQVEEPRSESPAQASLQASSSEVNPKQKPAPETQSIFPYFRPGQILKFSEMFGPVCLDYKSLLSQRRKKRKPLKPLKKFLRFEFNDWIFFDDSKTFFYSQDSSEKPPLSTISESSSAISRHHSLGLNAAPFNLNHVGSYPILSNHCTSLAEQNPPRSEDSADFFCVPSMLENGLKVETEILRTEPFLATEKLLARNSWVPNCLQKNSFYFPDSNLRFMFCLCDWENDIIWSDDDEDEIFSKYKSQYFASKTIQQILLSSKTPSSWLVNHAEDCTKSGSNSASKKQNCFESAVTPTPGSDFDFHHILPNPNQELAQDRWLRSIIWDDSREPEEAPLRKLILDQNDFNMTFEYVGVDKPAKKEKTKPASIGKLKSTTAKKPDDFIEDEDIPEAKDSAKTNPIEAAGPPAASVAKVSVQGAQRLRIVHSVPSLKLHDLYFSTHLPKTFLRNWHRPPLSNLADHSLFYPVRCLMKHIRKKQKEREKEMLATGGESFFMKKPKDLTAKDGDIVLFEYSEEYPPLVANIGMSMILYSYYRPKSAADKSHPKFKNGQLCILNAKISFSYLGDLIPGTSMQGIESSLFAAPVFSHSVPYTDFLVIRNGSKHYIREVRHIFLVGQTFPRYEVPAPNTRRANLYVKERLHVYLNRLFRPKRGPNGKEEARKITYELVKKAFPHFSDIVLRKRLKALANCIDDAWILRPGVRLPSEEELRSIITPEQVCGYESMAAGLQRLKDWGHNTRCNLIDHGDFEEGSTLKRPFSAITDFEIKVAPWNITRSLSDFMLNKCYLDIWGPGDPTGCGEGYSYIRAPLKPTGKSEFAPFLRNLPPKIAIHILTTTFQLNEKDLSAMDPHQLLQLFCARFKESSKVSDHLSRFLRKGRSTATEQSQMFNERAQFQFLVQNRILTCKEALSSDEEPLDEALPPEPDRVGARSRQEMTDFDEFGKDLEEDLLGISGGTHHADPASPAPNQSLSGARKSAPFRAALEVGSASASSPDTTRKTLLIHRKYLHADGRPFTKTQVIRDVNVIELYLARVRGKDGDAENNHDDFSDDGFGEDAAENAGRGGALARKPVGRRRIKGDKIVEKMKKPKKLTLAKERSTTTRTPSQVRCGACGNLGHNKMNRICPHFQASTFSSTETIPALGGDATLAGNLATHCATLDPSQESVSSLINVQGTKLKFNKLIVEALRGEHDEQSAAEEAVSGVAPLKIKLAVPKPRKRKSEVVFEEGDEFLLYKTPKNHRRSRRNPVADLSILFNDCLQSLFLAPASKIFTRPVSAKAYPNYYSIIQDPMDLSTMKKRCEREIYTSQGLFMADIDKIVNNCELFNGSNSHWTAMAKSLKTTANEFLATHQERFRELENEAAAEPKSDSAPLVSSSSSSLLMQDANISISSDPTKNIEVIDVDN